MRRILQHNNGVDYLYKPESNELKESAQIPLKSLNSIIESAIMLVENAEQISYMLNEEFGFEEK